jgi:O-antigen/teichoic acid export membrane protein
MLLSPLKILRGIGWTFGTYAVSIVFRFGSSVILSRLLDPNILGIMLIITTIRNGIELLSDVGIGQNIVQNKNGNRPYFYNTAWIIQIIRGVILSSFLFFLSREIAEFYKIDQYLISVSALTLLMMGFYSTSIYLLQRNIQISKLTLFDLSQEIIASLLAVIAALISPSVLSLVIANVIATVVRGVCTYLLPKARQRFVFSARYAWEIVSFGKWMFLSSLLMLLSTSFDRLYLGQAAPLAMFGIYGIAKALADLPGALVGRLSHALIFPIIASARSVPRAEVRANLSKLRRLLLAGAAIVLALGISVADIVIRVVYDDRYLDAGWMLPLLLTGVWFTILASINEYTLLGIGRPVYGVVGSAMKFLYLLIFLPYFFRHYGMLGAVACIAMADLVRIPAIFIGQLRERFSFLRQDIVATCLLFAVIGSASWFRMQFGFGSAFQALPG